MDRRAALVAHNPAWVGLRAVETTAVAYRYYYYV